MWVKEDVSFFGIGKLLDYNYQATAEAIGFQIDKLAGDDLKTFPIEKARARMFCHFVGVCTGFLVSYGWALENRTVMSRHLRPVRSSTNSLQHISIPLVLQFLIGFTTTCIVQVCGGLSTVVVVVVVVFAAAFLDANRRGDVV